MTTHASAKARFAAAAPSEDAPPRCFHVYVVELDHHALGISLPCVYVGETGLTPPERFDRHRTGARTSARVVHRYAVRLRPDLSSGWGPYPDRAGSVAAEGELTAVLRAAGYRVFGGQGRAFMSATTAAPAATVAGSTRRTPS